MGIKLTLTVVNRFGWTNASYTYGLTIIGEELKEFLRKGMGWEDVERERLSKTQANSVASYEPVTNGHA